MNFSWINELTFFELMVIGLLVLISTCLHTISANIAQQRVDRMDDAQELKYLIELMKLVISNLSDIKDDVHSCTYGESNA